jgi:DNA recombination protein RmuC
MEILILIVVIIILVVLIIVITKIFSIPEPLKSSDLKNLTDKIDKIENVFRTEFSNNRGEISNSLKNYDDSISKRVLDISTMQNSQMESFANRLATFTKTIDENLSKIIQVIDSKLKDIQNDNNKKLEEMRITVDEKLHKTLDTRLTESFRLVSDKLDAVHKGLGEMQILANGVGDLKKVLSNIKTRGIMGEYQLENILEQLLTPEQYSKNVKTKKGSSSMVEFAVKLPGKGLENKNIWLPIDSKFPLEDYHKLVDSYEKGDISLIEQNQKELLNKIKISAKDIKDKYIDPPNTTDFAIMFLPIEGLYAEILRHVGIFELLQKSYKVIITGPTTLSAILNSLQMGFRTLAIEKRTSEVWEVLGAVKTEFGNFGAILDKTQKKLHEASSVIDQASVRSRVIERKLQNVQKMPSAETKALLESGGEEPEKIKFDTENIDEASLSGGSEVDEVKLEDIPF